MLSEQALAQKLDELNPEITPERDLWRGIELAIAGVEPSASKEPSATENSQKVSKSKSSAKIHLAWAASLLISLGGGWYGMQEFNLQSVEQKYTQAQLPAPALSLVSTFNQQRQQLLVSLGQPDLTGLSQQMQTQFDELNSAKQTLYKALADDPDNGDLLNLLTWLQQQELALLEQLYRPQWQTI
jgi:hypothetical protein